MTYLAAALFFSLVLLAALVTVHMIVRRNWREILLALRGELGAATPPASAAAPAAATRRHAAL